MTTECVRCRKSLSGSQRKYCSCACSNRARQKHANALTCERCRRPFTAATNVDLAHRRFRRFRGENLLERGVRLELERRGIAFTQEAAMGRYSVDFLLSGPRIALEVDGAYWHRNTTDRDARKAAWLHKHGWRVIRLAEADVESLGPEVALARALHLSGSVTA